MSSTAAREAVEMDKSRNEDCRSPVNRCNSGRASCRNPSNAGLQGSRRVVMPTVMVCSLALTS